MTQRMRGAWAWRLSAVLLAATPAVALETDQYLAWSTELEDSAPAIDRYLDGQLALVLGRVNRAPAAVACPEIPVRFFRRLAPSLVYSRIRGMLGEDPGVDRFPDRDVGYLGYLRDSIYRRPTWPFVLPMSRVVRVGDVYTGADKLGGHLFGFGRRYYLRYRRLQERGVAEEEAVRRVLAWGYRVERTLVGGLADGVFSPADLEANYRGLLLARSFCEGERPLVERRGGRWRAVRGIGIRSWVTPYFDETFNPSFYVGYRWRKVREPLAEHCAGYQRPGTRRRLAGYARRAAPSRSQALVAERLRRGSAALLAHSVRAVCPAAEGIVAAVATPHKQGERRAARVNAAGSGSRP